MKLGAAAVASTYATEGRTVGTWNDALGFTQRGRLPIGRSIREQVLDRQLTGTLVSQVVGAITRSTVWELEDDRLLATLGRRLHASSDGGRSWTLVHNLPSDSGPMGVLPTSVCRHDGRVYLAEYRLTGTPARVLVSETGRDWKPYCTRRDVRHFHGVFSDPIDGELWGTTGDRNAESAIGVFRDGRFHPIGWGSQRWRAVELAFTEHDIIWGMDCPYQREVEILRLPRTAVKESLDSGEKAEPETIGTIDGPVFYAKTIRDGGDEWVILSTAATSTIDRTAPQDARFARSDGPAEVVGSPAWSGFRRWYRLGQFYRRHPIGEPLPGMPTTAAYVFLGEHSDGRLLVNPFNTRNGHGSIMALHPAKLATREVRVDAP